MAASVFGIVVLLLYTLVLGSTGNEAVKRQQHQTSTPSSPDVTSPSDPLAAWMSSTSSSKPNVLFIISDDVRPKLGCYGEMNMATPNLDFLASKSVLFKQAFVQEALCSPSRTSFLTGRRPETTRVFDLHTYFRKVAGNFTTLPQHFKNHGYFTQNVGKVFHPGVASGKTDDFPYSWSATAFHGHQPVSHAQTEGSGCAKAAKFLGECMIHNYTIARNLSSTGTQVRGHASFTTHCTAKSSSIHPVNVSKTGKLQDTDIADFAINFLKTHANNRDQPFFLAVGFHKPHLPWIFPKKYLDLYPLSNIHLADHRTKPPQVPDLAWTNVCGLRGFPDIKALNVTNPDKIIPDHYQYKIRQAYSAATSYMDAQVGRVLQALNNNGFAENTIVSFLGDHGWQLGENAEWCKQTLYDMALRIPMMIYIPGVTAVGHQFKLINALAPGFDRLAHIQQSKPVYTTDQLVEAVDLFSTISELAGLPVPHTCPENSLDVALCTEGTSLVPLIRKVRGLSQGETFHWKDATFSVQPRQWEGHSPVLGYTVRTKTHRYTEWVPYDKVHFKPDFSQVLAQELYRHSDDPFEFHNLAEVTSYSETVTQLSTKLHQGWRKTLNKLP